MDDHFVGWNISSVAYADVEWSVGALVVELLGDEQRSRGEVDGDANAAEVHVLLPTPMLVLAAGVLACAVTAACLALRRGGRETRKAKV